MSYKPQDFFLSALEFFGVLVPGAIVSYCGLKFSHGTSLEPHIKLIGEGIEGWIVFLVVSFIVGYALQPPSHILNKVYNHTYRAIKRRQVDHLYEFAKSKALESIPNILQTGSVYRWAEVDVTFRDPKAAGSIQMIQGISKLFRSLTLICVVGSAIALYQQEWLIAVGVLLIGVTSFLIFAERRWNATCFVYQKFKVLHEEKTQSSTQATT